MEVVLDREVQAIAEYMQRSLPAASLVRVSRALADVGPLLWTAAGEGNRTLSLLEPPIS
jgi:hypothetical protein